MASSLELEQAQRAEQLRWHRGAVRGSLSSAVLVGPLLVALVWHGHPPQRLLAWLAGLAVLVSGRAVVGAWHRLTPHDPADDGAWLLRYRLSFVVHGLAWAAAALWLLPESGGAEFNVVVFALTIMCAGSLVTTTFDPTAAVAFVAPVLSTLLTRLLAAGANQALATSLLVLLFVAATLLSTLRSNRSLKENVRLRVADAERADALRRSAEQAQTAGRALAEKHHLIDLLLHTTQQGFWFIDNDGLTTDVNPAMCALLGRPREAVLGRSVFEFFHGEERRIIEAQLARRAQGHTGGYEVAIVRPDGTRRHCFNNATPLVDAEGRKVGSIGLWTDLSTRREAELTLRIYEAVANSITDLVSVVGEDRVYRMVNDTWCMAMGVSREQAIGHDAALATPQAATPERLQALRECIASGRPRTLRGRSENPRYADRQIETTFYPFGADAAGVRCAVTVTRDISEPERARAALAESAEYLRGTLNATGDAIFASDAVDPSQPVRFANDQMLQMWGIAREDATGLTPAEIMAHAMPLFADPQAEAQRVQAIIASERPDESRVHLRDGRVLVRRCIPARIGARAVRVWSFRDVSAEERALEVVRNRAAEQSALLDAFPGLIARIDAGGRYTYVNERLAAMHGRRAQDIVGSTITDLLGDDMAQPLQDHLARALAGETVRYERHQAADAGRPARHLQVTMVRGVDPQTGSPALYGFGLDVSELKLAEQALRASESELRALLDAFPGHISVVDQDTAYTYVNPRYADLIGRPPAQIVGRPAREIVGDPRFALKAAEMTLARQGERIVSERNVPGVGGRPPVDLEVTLVAGPRQADGRQAFYSFGVDITARKRAEEAMAAARDEAERANRAKSQFLAQMSHELRTPMNAILGFGQLLGSDPLHVLTESQQGYVREILHGGRHLLDLINDVLDLGRIEAGKLVVDAATVPLGDVAEECLGLVRPLAAARGVQLEPVDPAWLGAAVAADRMRLKQVLLNLLANAIKYNRPGGHVSLVCTPADGFLRLGVRDTGHGLSPADLARLFQPFERLGAASTATEGTGIGLVLSRRLAEAMGGTIEVDSEVGIGSTFWLRLPLAAPRAAAAFSGKTMPGALMPAEPDDVDRCVLYIEDNAVNVVLMEAMLARLPRIRMRAAATPVEGLQLARSEMPALILCDIQLPGMDGYEVLRRLRSRAETRDIPVIAVTANAMASEADGALAAGFSGYLTKPLDLDTLLETVRLALLGGELV